MALIEDQTAVIARDWREYYRPAALAGDITNVANVANPPYIQLLFRPLALLPMETGYVILLILYMICFRLIAHLSPVNKWLIFPSFPSLWMLVYGQIDAFVALGVALGWWAIRNDKPYWQGAATLLLCIKPHIGGPLAIVYLVWQKNRRAFLVSGLFLIITLAVFGLWPIQWSRRMIREAELAIGLSGFASRLNDWNNIGSYPYGLLLLPLLFLPYSRIQKVPAIISASILAAPFAGAYSMLSTMSMPLPLWIYPILSLPLFIQRGYDLIIIAPLALVLFPAITYLLRYWPRLNRVNDPFNDESSSSDSPS